MKFSDLAKYLERLEKTSSRLAMTDILAELLKKADKNEIDKIIYLSLGYLAPQYKGIVFNIAERMMIRAVALAFNINDEKVKSLYKKSGDLGQTAEALSTELDSGLTVTAVYDALSDIAKLEGEGSQDEKIRVAAELMQNLDSLSIRFVARIPVGKLRLGFSDKTVIDALSIMALGDKSGKTKIEKAYGVVPDVGTLAREIKNKGVEKATENINPIVGIPVMPMLAQRLKSPVEMIKKMGTVAVEPKFDGLRVLIHYEKGHGVKAFTRNLNEISEMFPELQEIGKCMSAKSAILDSEAVGLDPDTKKMVDFQRTMQRRRKHNILESARNTPLRFQLFDVIYKDGESLMSMPYLDRRKVLEKLINKNSTFVVDESVITDDPKIIRDKHKELIKKGLEGVIVKKADSHYVPGRTGWRWVKMKEAEEAEGKLSDTLDCVVMGYTRGKGKRAAFGIGQFLAGVRDGDSIKTITKVGTGLTDDQFRELSKRLKKIRAKDKPKEYEVHKDLEPDFWVDPEVVVELAADEITVSPKHTAGFALRFPRLVKFRDDKSVRDATTLTELRELHVLA